jgi:hypothetical protein
MFPIDAHDHQGPIKQLWKNKVYTPKNKSGLTEITEVSIQELKINNE